MTCDLSGRGSGSGRTKMGDSGGSHHGSPTRALARSPVAWTVELEAPRGRARGKDEVEKRGFPDAAPTKSETNRIHRTVARRGESESNVCAP